MLWKKHQGRSSSSAMTSPGDNVHTSEHPYCSNLGCWCHTNLEYHSQVTDFQAESDVDDTLFAFALALLAGK
jgi:hypothetical protein